MRLTKEMFNNIPKFVSGGLRLRKTDSDDNDYEYYRDGGNWSVDFRFENGKIFSVSNVEDVNNMELTEILKEEWREANQQYAPDWV